MLLSNSWKMHRATRIFVLLLMHKLNLLRFLFRHFSIDFLYWTCAWTCNTQDLSHAWHGIWIQGIHNSSADGRLEQNAISKIIHNYVNQMHGHIVNLSAGHVSFIRAIRPAIYCSLVYATWLWYSFSIYFHWLGVKKQDVFQLIFIPLNSIVNYWWTRK